MRGKIIISAVLFGCKRWHVPNVFPKLIGTDLIEFLYKAGYNAFLPSTNETLTMNTENKKYNPSYTIGGDLTVNRMGYGAMLIT